MGKVKAVKMKAGAKSSSAKIQPKRQAHTHLAKSSDFERVVVCGSPERASHIATRLKNSRAIAKNREYHSFLGDFDSRPVLVISHGIGAAGAGICFHELAEVGAKLIIRVGTAGGLQDFCKQGDLVVATGAAREDGLTPRLVPLGFPALPDPLLTLQLQDRLRPRKGDTFKQNIYLGPILTSDLFYPGPLPSTLPLYKAAGTIAVEMEAAALFVIGHLRQVKTAAVVALDGNPLKWDEGNYDPHSKALALALEHAIDGALETASGFDV